MTRSQHMRRLGLLLLVAASNSFCVMDRGASRIKLSAAGDYAYAGDRSYGCDGEVLHEERHNQVGGTGTVRYEQRYGFNAQVQGSVFHGDPVGSGNTYWMGSAAALLGWDFQYVGFDLGASMLFSQDPDASEQVFPIMTLRAGRLDRVWGELGMGPLLGPHDSRVAYTGVAGQADGWSYHAGFAFLARPLISNEWGDLTLGTMSDGLDIGLYATIAVPLGEIFSLDLGGIVAESPSFNLGLSASF